MADRDAPRAWRTVLDRIEADLTRGALRPGDRLPGERELAARLGVGRSSVREALRVLDVMGVIRTASGSGPAAGAMIVAAPADGLAALLRLQAAAQAFPVDNVVATRLVLESAVVETLAAAGADLAPASALFEAMSQPGLSTADFLALDARFHHALAEASGNAVTATIMSGLRSAIETYTRAGAERLPDWEGTAVRLQAEHAAVLDAVRSGDAAAARDRIRAHITGYHAQVRAALGDDDRVAVAPART